MSFIVRCRYWSTDAGNRLAPKGPDGIGYLDSEGRCTRAFGDAKLFDHEADAWEHARTSGERVPDDCWAESTADMVKDPAKKDRRDCFAEASDEDRREWALEDKYDLKKEGG